MTNTDFSNELAEKKVLILYILSHIPHGISELSLYEIMDSIEAINYFYFKHILMNLVDTNLVAIFSEDDEDSTLKIGSKGKEVLNLTINALPGLEKLKADNILKEKIPSINNETSISAEFIPKSGTDYTVRCRIIESNQTLFEIKTFAGSRDRAQKIVDNWNKNASKIYPKVLSILLEDNIDNTDNKDNTN